MCPRSFRSILAAGIPVIVHENFRFQPWYRALKRELSAGRIGDVLRRDRRHVSAVDPGDRNSTGDEVAVDHEHPDPFVGEQRGNPRPIALVAVDGHRSEAPRRPVGALRQPDPDGVTVEAVAVLDALYETGEVRVLASRWNGSKKTAGWAFGVTSKKSKHEPRNLIM